MMPDEEEQRPFETFHKNSFVNLVLSRVTLETFLGLGLTVTEINIKKVQKQDFKKTLKM